jgi:hypothetical protein
MQASSGVTNSLRWGVATLGDLPGAFSLVI